MTQILGTPIRTYSTIFSSKVDGLIATGPNLDANEWRRLEDVYSRVCCCHAEAALRWCEPGGRPPSTRLKYSSPRCRSVFGRVPATSRAFLNVPAVCGPGVPVRT